MLHKLDINTLGVATITLNRPEVHNAFNDVLIKELIEVFHTLDQNKKVRVVVITGEGKSFCAGADLHWMKQMKDYSLEENITDANNLSDLFYAINFCRYPVIAVLNGHALGGGAGIVACADYVLAVDSASIGFTEVKLGLVPAVISPFVIAKIGESYARATFLSGEKFDMEMAMRMGLVHKISTATDLSKNTELVIAGFLSAGPQATLEAKQLIKNVIGFHSMPTIPTIPNVKEYTCKTIAKIRTSEEGQEGMSALLEKRKAKWL